MLGCESVLRKAPPTPPGIKMNSYEVLPLAVDRKTLLKCESSILGSGPQGRKGRAGPLGASTSPVPPPFRSGLQRDASSLLPWDWRPQKDSKALIGKGEDLSCPTTVDGARPLRRPRGGLCTLPGTGVWHNLCPQLAGCQPPLGIRQASLEQPVHFFFRQSPFSFGVPSPGWTGGQIPMTCLRSPGSRWYHLR